VRLAWFALASCGWLPPDSPPQKPAAPDPLAHAWTVENHVLAANATMSESDARERHGREKSNGELHDFPLGARRTQPRRAASADSLIQERPGRSFSYDRAVPFDQRQWLRRRRLR